MTIPFTCTCGRAFEFNDDFAGQQLDCPDCQAKIVVPAAPARPPQADPVFERDRFLINQKIRLDEKYAITDEQGRELLFVIRPRHLLRNTAALLVGVTAAFAWAGCLFWLAPAGPGLLPTILGVLGLAGFFPIAVSVALPLSRLRDVTFYRDESLREALLTIAPDKKFQPIIATYTVRDAQGRPLAHLKKNYLYNFIRKRWYMDSPDGREIAVAMEDSALKAFLRRFLGPLFGLLRTNFEIQSGDSDRVVGMFNRRMTLLDRYVLDMTSDPKRTMDRRLALALGVMLDSGERR
jgi:uncharacterized protein YxjI/DNA-directed RNA polymerase subunit RPC12/RpoP